MHYIVLCVVYIKNLDSKPCKILLVVKLVSLSKYDKRKASRHNVAKRYICNDIRKSLKKLKRYQKPSIEEGQTIQWIKGDN